VCGTPRGANTTSPGLARAISSRVQELPHRERYLRISHAFVRAVLETHTDLVDRVEEELHS
jgi:hypothetical protein